MATQQQTEGQGGAFEPSELQQLLNQEFKPRAAAAKEAVESAYGQFGGEPFACLVGDYYFDHTPPDAELVGQMAQVAAAAHCPFIAGVSPSVMQMESWQELANPRDLTKIFGTPEYAPCRSLRESEDSRYIGLAMPRFLGRYPYGKANPVEEFDFREDT